MTVVFPEPLGTTVLEGLMLDNQKTIKDYELHKNSPVKIAHVFDNQTII